MELGELLFTIGLDDKTFATGIDKNKKLVQNFTSAIAKDGTTIRSSFKLTSDTTAVWGKAAEKVTGTLDGLRKQQLQLKTTLDDYKASGGKNNELLAVGNELYAEAGRRISDISKHYKIFDSATGALTAKQTQLTKDTENLIARGFSPQSKQVQNLNKQYDALTISIDGIKKSSKSFLGELDSSFSDLTERQTGLKKEIQDLIAFGINPQSETIKKLKKDYDNVGLAITKVENSSKSFNENLASISKTAMIVGAVLTATVTRAILNLSKSMVEYAANLQFYQASFEVMLGSASRAAEVINDLRIMAAKTPFEMKDLTAGARTLVQFGESANTVMKTVKVLGDIAQGNNERFQALSLAYAQMSSAGRLLAQDLYQMVNAGFNPLLVMSQKTGRSLMDLRDDMKKGLITTEMVKEAFYAAADAGGKFYQGMERASKTLKGLISTLKDDAAMMGKTFTDVFMNDIMNAVKGLSSAVKWVGELNSSIKAFTGTMVLATAAIGPLLTVIGAIGMGVSLLSTLNPLLLKIELIIGAIALVTAAFIGLRKTAEQVRLDKAFADVSSQLKTAVDNGADLEKTIIKVANETGFTVGKVVELAKKEGLVTISMENQIEELAKIYEIEDRRKASVEDIVKLNKTIVEQFESLVISGFDVEESANSVASSLGVSVTRVLSFVTNSKLLSKEQKDILEFMKGQTLELEKQNKAEAEKRRAAGVKTPAEWKVINEALDFAEDELKKAAKLPIDKQITLIQNLLGQLDKHGIPSYYQVYQKAEKALSDLLKKQRDYDAILEGYSESSKKAAEEKAQEETRLNENIKLGILKNEEDINDARIKYLEKYRDALIDIKVKFPTLWSKDNQTALTTVVADLVKLGASSDDFTLATIEFNKALDGVHKKIADGIITNIAGLKEEGKLINNFIEKLIDLNKTETEEYKNAKSRLAVINAEIKSQDVLTNKTEELEKAQVAYNTAVGETTRKLNDNFITIVQAEEAKLSATDAYINKLYELGYVNNAVSEEIGDRILAQQLIEKKALTEKVLLTQAQINITKTLSEQENILFEATKKYEEDRLAAVLLYNDLLETNADIVQGSGMEAIELDEARAMSIEMVEERTRILNEVILEQVEITKNLTEEEAISYRAGEEYSKKRLEAANAYNDLVLTYSEALKDSGVVAIEAGDITAISLETIATKTARLNAVLQERVETSKSFAEAEKISYDATAKAEEERTIALELYNGLIKQNAQVLEGSGLEAISLDKARAMSIEQINQKIIQAIAWVQAQVDATKELATAEDAIRIATETYEKDRAEATKLYNEFLQSNAEILKDSGLEQISVDKMRSMNIEQINALLRTATYYVQGQVDATKELATAEDARRVATETYEKDRNSALEAYNVFVNENAQVLIGSGLEVISLDKARAMSIEQINQKLAFGQAWLEAQTEQAKEFAKVDSARVEATIQYEKDRETATKSYNEFLQSNAEVLKDSGLEQISVDKMRAMSLEQINRLLAYASNYVQAQVDDSKEQASMQEIIHKATLEYEKERLTTVEDYNKLLKDNAAIAERLGAKKIEEGDISKYSIEQVNKMKTYFELEKSYIEAIDKEENLVRKKRLQSILESIKGWEAEGLSIDQTIQKLKELEEEYQYLTKKAAAALNSFASGLNNIASAIDIVNTLVTGNIEDMSANIFSLSADIASAFGPEGQLIASVLRGMSAFQTAMNNFIISIVGDYEAQQKRLLDLEKMVFDTAFDKETARHNNKISNLEKERDAELEKLGLIDKTESEMAQERLDDAKEAAATDAESWAKKIADLQLAFNSETSIRRKAQIQKDIDIAEEEAKASKVRNDEIIAEAEKAAKKAAIEQEWQDKIDEENRNYEAAKRKYAYDTAVFNKKMALAQIKIDRQKAKAELGLFNWNKKKEVDAIYDTIESLVNSTPLPSLATGGIALPKPGGRMVNVAEAGIAEAIIPLNRLNEVLQSIEPSRSVNPSYAEQDLGDIHLVVNIDSKPILSKVFQATRNRTVLIDSGAVV